MKHYLIKILIVVPYIFLYGKEIAVHPEPGKGVYDKPFFPMNDYKENILPPDSLWGFSLGSKPASHDDIITYFEYLDEVFTNASAKGGRLSISKNDYPASPTGWAWLFQVKA